MSGERTALRAESGVRNQELGVIGIAIAIGIGIESERIGKREEGRGKETSEQ